MKVFYAGGGTDDEDGDDPARVLGFRHGDRDNLGDVVGIALSSCGNFASMGDNHGRGRIADPGTAWGRTCLLPA